MADEAPPKRTLKERLSALFADYGRVAIYTYLTLSLLAIIGFSIAIGIGAEPSSATGFFGVIVAGWAAAKVTLPIRVLITLGITPFVAHVVRKFWPKPPDDDLPDDAPADNAPPAA